MTKYSVKQLSELAGVSIRTLHHYDRIGLLKPSFRSEKGYRFYERKELLLLQQILFYKELGFALSDIDAIINDPSFNLVVALESHKKELKKRFSSLKQLLKTVDKTIVELKNKEKMMTDDEIYAGFPAKEAAKYRKEAVEKWGEDKITEVEDRIREMEKQGWEDTQKKGEEINWLLADLMDLKIDDIRVQKGVEMHFRHMNTFYEVNKERYLDLGKMYTEDDRFTAFYGKYREGLADFLYAAIQVFCENDLKVKE
ncbi:MerR family DNA-binding transcriptional regulator [Leptobacterium flavescens]|uniref:MerR family DNA-binding transcriptional regulator n=1 Tax=Leptobacterium flavescens TaxID=472055 RepID=A0A6P0UMT9_9FLAO|nr:MerR family transcriptional regulator [Leptobacterium flavescens]NER14681.1 MerR family DNA-binding transcriptional regulator [Leptobacterium flavescens]